MKIDSKMTDAVVLRQLGERMAGLRLSRNLTQQQLAEQAGLGLRTVQRLELGMAATLLSGWVRVLRVLGLVDRLEVLLPEPTEGPMVQLKRQGRRRQRARRPKAADRSAKPWTWGEPV
ncbi:MAG: helix-turn-helix transcriptional regulator [Verrucomicrobiota bacterium]